MNTNKPVTGTQPDPIRMSGNREQPPKINSPEPIYRSGGNLGFAFFMIMFCLCVCYISYLMFTNSPEEFDKNPAVSSYSWLSVSPDVSKEEAIKKCEELVNANRIVMESKYGNPVINPILYTDPVTKQSIVHTCEEFFNWISQSKLEYCQVQ